MFYVRITLNAANFSAASPVVTFSESMPLEPQFPSDICARILGYSYYAPGSDPHTWSLFLAPAAAAPTAHRILLEDNNGPNDVAGTYFTVPCGRDGIIVPRRFGIESVVQPPAGAVGSGETYQLFFETAGAVAADACFTCWYELGSTG